MSYDKRTVNRGPAVFLRECRALGIRFAIVDGRIVTDEQGGTLQAYIAKHETELRRLLEVELCQR